MSSKWTEQDAIVSETINAVKVAQMEGMRDTLGSLRPNLDGGSSLAKRVNPFVHHDRIDSWELAKIVIGFVVVPLRLMIMLFLFLLICLLLEISVIGADRTKPFQGWRRFLQIVCSRTLQRAFLFVAGLVHISVKGAPAPSTSPWQARMCVVAPHSSFLDGFIISYLLDVPSVVAKKEASGGLMGILFSSSQSILVDRKSKSARAGALTMIIDRVQSELPWRHIFLFPEGTCTNRRALINFKIGAFAPARPVQPILLHWEKNVNFDPAWTSAGPNRTWLMFRFLCQVYTSIEVEFLPVYIPNEIEREDAGVFAAGVRTVMAEKLGVPTTEHSYEDSFLASLARKRKLNPQVSMPHEFSELAKLHDVTYDDATRLLKRFTEVKRKKKNYSTPMATKAPQITELSSEQIDHSLDRLDMQEFAELLGLPLSGAVVEFFSYLDVTGEGSIDFPAFLVGLTFLSQKATIEESAKLIWATLDRNDTGTVEIKHVKKVLDMIFRRVDNRTIPLLREAKGKPSGSITFDEFVSLLRLHPEYIPIALSVTSVPVDQRAQQHLSLTSANLKLTETLQQRKIAETYVKERDGSLAEGADLKNFNHGAENKFQDV